MPRSIYRIYKMGDQFYASARNEFLSCRKGVFTSMGPYTYFNMLDQHLIKEPESASKWIEELKRIKDDIRQEREIPTRRDKHIAAF